MSGYLAVGHHESNYTSNSLNEKLEITNYGDVFQSVVEKQLFVDTKNLWRLLRFYLQRRAGAGALQLDQAQRGPADKVGFNRIAAECRAKDGFQLPPVFFGHRRGVNDNLTAQTSEPQLTR